MSFFSSFSFSNQQTQNPSPPAPMQQQTQNPSPPPMQMQMQQQQQIPQQQQQQQMFSSSFSLNSSQQSHRSQHDSKLARRIFQKQDDRELPPCAVIVTIVEGSSYDHLYRHNPQISPDPTQTVALFELNYSALIDVLHLLRGESINDSTIQAIIHEIMDCISRVDPDSVVFNFECCSSCSESGFGQSHHRLTILPLVSLLLSHQHIVMFGDFSLKGLIHDWDEELLGPNPFINCGSTSTAMTLKFNPEELTNCCNAQLQNVGRMCETGRAVVNVMGGTIVFRVNSEKSDTTRYSLEVLTRCTNQEQQDACGHVMLTYPSGGRLLVSAGHWIELSHLSGATEESVLKMCSAQLGQVQADQMMSELTSCNTVYEREQVVQRNAQQVVWSSAPCRYTSKS